MAKRKRKRSFVIPRSRWLHGEGKEVSYLYREADGKMCCVGLYLKACGVPVDYLLGKCSAVDEGVCSKLPSEAKWLINSSLSASKEAYSLYEVNDAVVGSSEVNFESLRENKIRQVFKEQGVTVRFMK